MDIEEKKIFFVVSPHINYYHSYRGDSRGESGFGQDVRIMEEILNQLDSIEERGLCNGITRISWDYGDTFWSIQLQREYQQNVLDRVIERCKKGKDEVLIGSWGNVAQPVLDTEELHTDHKWFLENSMRIGIKQIFPPERIAPYARTQETMFTQGMIEEYIRMGIEGITNYYSVIPFDVSRPFLNPRLTWNQMYCPIKFKSVISDVSILMIPMYSFGDILDYLSIKRWFELIRKRQESGEISGHALLFLNFDMDADTWIGIKLPKPLQWMPNSRGLRELAEAVDLYDFVEFGNLLDIIPKLQIQGETILREDVADGSYNGYYNWAQKYNNTKFWTVGQRARWLKCVSDTLIDSGMSDQTKYKINESIRNGNDLSDTYIKNKILFASTTNFGMSMPFLHHHRHKTAMIYALKSHQAANKAAKLAITEKIDDVIKSIESDKYYIMILPVINRGLSEREKKPVKSPILIKSELPTELSDILKKKNKYLKLEDELSKDIQYSLYINDKNSRQYIEALLSESSFKKEGYFITYLSTQISPKGLMPEKNPLRATTKSIENDFIKLEFNEKGKIVSLKYNRKEFACPSFLDSVVTFGKKKGKRYGSDQDKIVIIRDGADNFSASIKIISDFEIISNHIARTEKIITLYRGIPSILVKVKMTLPDIKGEEISKDGTTSVRDQYDIKWQEIMPCEIKPNIIGNGTPLRIWKHNFLGHTTYFDLDMREVDSKNADIDCLVANISDGWMAMSNQNEGMLIGFNSLKAANFAFSPIKIREKGFGDALKKGQQIRINPFGTYYGKMLNYWTEGTGHAQKLVTKLSTTFQSSAPTFSGKTISFKLVISPYIGDAPPEKLISFANHFSLPPLVIIGQKEKPIIIENYSKYDEICKELMNEYDLKEIMELSYLEWVKQVNTDFDLEKDDVSPQGLKMGIGTLLRLLIDGIKGR
jgi:hypothetical protein